MATSKQPPALPHGELAEIFPHVFFVTGTVGLPGPLPVRFSRNMTVVRQGESLTLINSIRLDEVGLAKLEALGKIEHVIRIAGFHGMDDPFYKERYGAKVWSLRGQGYTTGFDAEKANVYFTSDAEIDATTELPIAGAKMFLFETKPAEGLLLLEREGGILLSGDCLQNWGSTDRYFSLPARLMMRVMGFIKPFNVGPAWLKTTKPSPAQMLSLLDMSFDHLLPAHGAAVIGGAKASYRPAIERAANR